MTTTTIKTVVEPKKLLNKENRKLLIILVLYSIGSGITLYNKTLLSSSNYENNLPLVKYLTIVKLGLVLIRLMISRKLGGAISGFTIFTNLLTLMLIQGAVQLKTLQSSFERFTSVLGITFDSDLQEFLVGVQEIDFWIHIIGGVNALAPLPKFINGILAVSVLLSQLATI